MAYREVTMLEVKEVLRLWLSGVRKKRIAAQLGLNVKTVRRYVRAAQAHGLTIAAHPDELDDGLLAAVVSTVQPGTRPHGEGWAACAAHRGVIEGYLRADVRLSKIRTPPGRPASEYGRLCQGAGGHAGGGRCRRVLMLTILSGA